MEIWKDIPGYENLYQASTTGNIKSNITNKILKPGDTRGYKNVVLTKEKVRKSFRVHQLVAITFLGHKINGMKSIIDHIDDNKSNNHISNLRITDNRTNTNKSKKNKKSKFRGVHQHTCRKWTSQIRIGNKREYLGLFGKEEEASEAYESRLKQITQ